MRYKCSGLDFEYWITDTLKSIFFLFYDPFETLTLRTKCQQNIFLFILFIFILTWRVYRSFNLKLDKIKIK